MINPFGRGKGKPAIRSLGSVRHSFRPARCAYVDVPLEAMPPVLRIARRTSADARSGSACGRPATDRLRTLPSRQVCGVDRSAV